MEYYNISSKKENNSEEWFYYNKHALEKLYYSLLKLSESYGILLKDNETKLYKLTKELGIKYCKMMIKHLPEWYTFLEKQKKKR